MGFLTPPLQQSVCLTFVLSLLVFSLPSLPFLPLVFLPLTFVSDFCFSLPSSMGRADVRVDHSIRHSISFRSTSDTGKQNYSHRHDGISNCATARGTQCMSHRGIHAYTKPIVSWQQKCTITQSPRRIQNRLSSLTIVNQ